MKKRMGLKVVALIVVLFLVFVANCIISQKVLEKSKDSFVTISEVYMNLHQKNSELVEHIIYAKLYMNQMMIAQDQQSMAASIDQSNHNTEELKVILDDMEDLCEKSKQPELQDKFKDYDDVLRQLIDTVAGIINAATSGKTQGIVASQGGIAEAYASVDKVEEAFNQSLDMVSEEVTRERIDGINHSDTYVEIGIVIYVLASVIAIVVVHMTIARPTKKATQDLQRIIAKIEQNEGDLTERVEVRTKDEVGQLVMGVNNFIEKLQGIMQTIQQESHNMQDSADHMMDGIDISNNNANDVSAAMQELSASMEAVAETLSEINQGAGEVLQESREISTQAKDGAEFVKEIKKRAAGIKTETIANKDNTSQMIESNRHLLKEAIHNSKSVEKINELTEEILSISSQTNLLALNASIEAARAGEAGKGFAVVAEEIRVLADDSRNTANNIQEISNLVTEAVMDLANNANEMLRFIDETILIEYDKFVDVAIQYDSDADSMDGMLRKFYFGATGLEKTMTGMTSGIEGVNTTMDDSAGGVTNAAESTNQLVEMLNDIKTEADRNKDISKLLNREVERFKHI